MNHRRWVCSIAIAAALSGAAMGEDANVKVREEPVVEKPIPFATMLGKLKFGDKVTVLEKLGAGWHRIESQTANKLTGWIRASALIDPQAMAKMTSGGARTTASASETLEAGKGLLEKGEQAYVAKQGLQQAMAQLDAIEKNPLFNIQAAEKQTFLSTGKITPKGGN